MASDIFAKIGDIKGESLDDKHKDEIEVLSWSWGVSNAAAMKGAGGGGAGKASFHDLSFTHHIDKASPVLMQACATGVHMKEATITHRKAGKGQQEFLIVKMSDVIVTSVTHGDRPTAPTPECVNLVFAKVDLEYVPQKPDGSLDARHTLQVRHQGQQGRVTRAAAPPRGDMEQSPASGRGLSLDEAISIAIVLQQNEQWSAAADIYHGILEVAPDRADALHFSGVLAHQQAQGEEAVALIERSLELEPERADWYSNLGIVLQDRLGWTKRPAPISARSRSTRTTPMRTTISVWY